MWRWEDFCTNLLSLSQCVQFYRAFRHHADRALALEYAAEDGKNQAQALLPPSTGRRAPAVWGPLRPGSTEYLVFINLAFWYYSAVEATVTTGTLNACLQTTASALYFLLWPPVSKRIGQHTAGLLCADAPPAQPT